jgi:hypothetical protein
MALSTYLKQALFLAALAGGKSSGGRASIYF